MSVTKQGSPRLTAAGRAGRGRLALRHRIVGLSLMGVCLTGLGVVVADAESADPAAAPVAYVMSDLACTNGKGALSLTLVNDSASELATFRLDAAPNLDTRSVVVAPGGRESVMLAGLDDGHMGFPVEVGGGIEHVQATVACGAGADKAALGTRVHHVGAQPVVQRNGTASDHTALLGAALVLAGAATAWVVRRRYTVAERSV
jgi:hypothetical protein